MGKLHPKVTRVAASCYIDDALADLNTAVHANHDPAFQLPFLTGQC